MGITFAGSMLGAAMFGGGMDASRTGGILEGEIVVDASNPPGDSGSDVALTISVPCPFPPSRGSSPSKPQS